MSQLSPRSRVLAEIEHIRARVKDLVTTNTYSAAVDKLDITEFCLDGAPLQARASAIEATCREIEAEAVKQKAALEVDWQRLKRERWDQNKVQQLELTDFTGQISVFSYPVRKSVPTERLSRQVNFWRAVNSRFSVSSSPPSEPIPFEYQSSALLSSTAVVTPRLRRIQSLLVAGLTETLRGNFNSVFSDASKRRAQLADQISVQQDRLKKIASELKDDSVLNLGRANIALPLSALEVDERELVSPVVFSEAELREQELARQRENSRRAKFEGSEMMRALQEMMGGKMKSKRELSPLETEIPREAFFDDPEHPPTAWTEDERKIFAEYEKKCRDLEIVREKYRAELRMETGKISEEIAKVVNTWKSELDSLVLKRAASDREILGLELYVVKLHLMDVNRKSQLSELAELQRNLEAAEQKTSEVRGILGERNSKLEEAHAEIERLFKREKSEILAAKSFLQKSGLIPSVVSSLMKAFKSPHPLYERPKEVEDSAVWEELLALKDERTQLISDLNEHQQNARVLTAEISALQADLASAEAVEGGINAEISDLQAKLDHAEFNVPVLLHLSSGDNEVPFGAIVTDYSDALLVDVSKTVLPRNRRIRELAEAKQVVLNDIAAFTKKLKAKEFDLEKLKLQLEDLKETTKDVHLAKVTRDLKSMLEEDPKVKTEKQLAVLTDVKMHITRAGEEKVRQLERFLEQVKKNIAKKERENEQIIERIRALQNTANSASLSMSEDGASAVLDAKTKFKGERKPVIAGGGKVAEDPEEIKEAQKAFRTTKSKAELVNMVKKHEAEIERLRKALDKFRQRTFPSFASNKELGYRRSPADIR